MGAKGKKKIWTMVQYMILAVILLFLMFPLYWVLMTSFKTNMEAYRFPPTMVPEAPNVQSYISLFTEDNFFFIYYKNNFIVSGITAGITLVLAIMSGYALSRFKIKWNQWIVAAFLSAQMFPIVSRMISLYDLLGKIHLINTRAGLILALTAAMLPFTITLMASFFDGIPKELEEASIVDGAGRFQTVTLIQNDSLRTLSAGVALRYLGELSYDWSKVNTISVVGILPIMCLFFFFQKYMVKGLVAGAVKG